MRRALLIVTRGRPRANASTGMHHLGIAAAIVALVGLGCAVSRAKYDYAEIARARRIEAQPANFQHSADFTPSGAATGAPVPESRPPAELSPKPSSASEASARSTPEPPRPGFDRELSLTDCIELALEANPDIGVAVARIRHAEAILDEARAPFLPVLSTSTEILGADSPSLYLFKTIDSRTFSSGTDFNYPGTFGSIETGVTLRYNLYNGGRDRLRRWMAATGRDLSQLGLQEARNSLAASVIQTFFTIQAQTEMVATTRLSVRTVRARYEETRAKMELGSALRSDVLSLKVRLAEAEERVIRAVNSRLLSISALANLLGEDADARISLGADEDDGWLPADLPEQYEVAVAEAMARRPELLQARRIVERAAMDVDSRWLAYLPRADAGARVYWTSTDFDYSGDRRNWFAGVTLSWDLFDGGSRKAQVDQARSVLDEMLSADRKMALSVQLDVKTAYLRMEEARARLGVAEATVEQAAESLMLVRSQYEEGTATITRFLETELMVTQARMRRTSAQYDLKRSRADAARTMGWLAADTFTLEEAGS